MIEKVLIANRGEIAARIIRTARQLGIGTVAVHSDVEASALHATEADERVAIGPAAAIDSYLKVEQILAAAERSGADAVHPGYGCLSESVDLATACRQAGLCFIGPPLAAIETLASKVEARRAAAAAGLTVVPGSEELEDLAAARAAARDLGYPVLLKPVVGGGGIGLRRVDHERDLEVAFARERRLAAGMLGDETLYLEKALERPRHVEVQVAGDNHGNLVHLGERECSIQRRYQKLVAETPSPAVDSGLRRELTEAALAMARAISFSSLGTVEMLLTSDGFHFLEMSSRLQVEHTVTEMVTGLDLVEWQIHIALGEPLPATQEKIEFDGHAIECRIYAEDPERGFEPSPGHIARFVVPVGPGVRNDVGVRDGDLVTPHYDPMLAKLVVRGGDRNAAIWTLSEALNSYQVDGVATNLNMHRRVVLDDAFVAGAVHTGFLGERLGLY
jgi:acetyl-CoA carboxylase biotin carboxylase subunit